MYAYQKRSFGVKGLYLLFICAGSMGAADLPDHVPGRLLAVARKEVDANQRLRALQLRGAAVRRQIPSIGVDVLDVPEASSHAIRQALQQSGLFESVEQDHYARLAGDTVPNDSLYGRQWHLPQISAPAAWGVTTGTASIVIAVIDSGIDANHPDLSSKLVPGWNFLLNTSDTTDILGHGTAVAGTVAAASDNAIGVAGVSWNSRIMPLDVVGANDFAAYSDIASAIEYATDHGARIINISIGGENQSSILQSAVDYAWSKNVAIFAAAMNDSSSQPNYPAACNHVVGVSATDSNGALASFSNFGSWISLAAPGSNILTTSMGGGYGFWSGTSFSSPIASGVAALALSVNPSLKVAGLVSILEQTADNGGNGFGTYFGWGRINAYKTVVAAMPFSLAVSPAPQIVALHSSQTQQFTASMTGVANPVVVWSVSPNVGTIGSTGIYTAPASIQAGLTVTVTAAISGQGSASSTLALLPDSSSRPQRIDEPNPPQKSLPIRNRPDSPR